MPEFVGRWSGHITDGAEAEHEAFLERLRSDSGRDLLRKYRLTGYTLYQRGSHLEIVFKSDKQSIIPGILRNKVLWPAFWEFEQPGSPDGPGDAAEVFHWSAT